MIHDLAYMSPAGERLLWVLLGGIVTASILFLRRAFIKWRNNPLRIKKELWYSGGLKMRVNIRNVRNMLAEIDTPVIEFYMPRMKKRKFKIVTPGEKNIFPLGLTPKTSYEFYVEFTKLYEREPILRKYRKIRIHVNDKYGKTITTKKVRIIKRLHYV